MVVFSALVAIVLIVAVWFAVWRVFRLVRCAVLLAGVPLTDGATNPLKSRRAKRFNILSVIAVRIPFGDCPFSSAGLGCCQGSWVSCRSSSLALAAQRRSGSPLGIISPSGDGEGFGEGVGAVGVPVPDDPIVIASRVHILESYVWYELNRAANTDESWLDV